MSGYAYEESTTGINQALSFITGEKVDKNILKQKNARYLYYDINTHGKNAILSVYVDGTIQTQTFTLNTTSRTRDRLENVPNWQGYRFAIGLSVAAVDDTDLEVYAPWGFEFTPFGD
jgi:hypothetical protein